MDDVLYFVCDVESDGLHGDGFAWGFVVVNGAGIELAHGYGRADTDLTDQWVVANVAPACLDVTCAALRELRDAFWLEWQHWQERGALMVADCAWPVEARFMAACVDDDRADREWKGPYPLHDVATARLAAGLDPLAAGNRLAGELPVHNPLADARQSARLWIEALASVTEPPTQYLLL
jgi:hypothetical protein